MPDPLVAAKSGLATSKSGGCTEFRQNPSALHSSTIPQLCEANSNHLFGWPLRRFPDPINTIRAPLRIDRPARTQRKHAAVCPTEERPVIVEVAALGHDPPCEVGSRQIFLRLPEVLRLRRSGGGEIGQLGSMKHTYSAKRGKDASSGEDTGLSCFETPSSSRSRDTTQMLEIADDRARGGLGMPWRGPSRRAMPAGAVIVQNLVRRPQYISVSTLFLFG